MVVLTEHLSDKAAMLASLRDQTQRLAASAVGATVASPRHRRRRQRRFTAAEVVKIGEQYRSGRSMNDLARQHGVHRNTILHALHRSDTPIRHRVSPQTEWPRQLGCTAPIGHWPVWGERYGCTDMAVAHALRQQGVQIRPRRGWSY